MTTKETEYLFDQVEQLQQVMRKLDAAAQKLEQVRKHKRIHEFEMQKAISQGSAHAEVAAYWLNKVVTALEQVTRDDA